MWMQLAQDRKISDHGADTLAGARKGGEIEAGVVLGAFACTILLIALFISVAVRSATGLTFDPHGYAMYAGILFTAILIPIALALWLLCRALHRRN